MALESDNLDEIWNEIVFLEESSVRRGEVEGRGQGQTRDLDRSWKLGVDRGVEIAAEVGFYQGFVRAWLRKGELVGSAGSVKEREKAKKSLQKLQQLVQDFPKENVKDDDFLEQLESIRAKFRQSCAVLKVKTEVPDSSAGIAW